MENPWEQINRTSIPSFSWYYVYIAFFLVIAAWVSNGFVQVKTGQEAIVLRFGKMNRKLHEGLNFIFPNIEQAIVEDVSTIRILEGNDKPININRNNVEDGILTGCGNLVKIKYNILYNIDDVFLYTFNVLDREATIRNVVESAFREVISNETLHNILSLERELIAEKVHKITQKKLDEYELGVNLQGIKIFETQPPSAVLAYYKDVQAAKSDKMRFENEGLLYTNSIIPEARGKAEEDIQKAIGYKQVQESKARGDVELFLALTKEYKANPHIVKTRLYFEMIEEILSNNKVIVTDKAFNHIDLNRINEDMQKNSKRRGYE